jgi:hypothetical protein
MDESEEGNALTEAKSATLVTQLRNQARPSCLGSFRAGFSGSLFYISAPRRAGPPIGLLALAFEFWHLQPFLTHWVHSET